MTSNSYESITFEVENGLKKPEQLYSKSGVKNIFSHLFIKGKQFDRDELRKQFRKLSEYDQEIQKKKINEELEILHYNFDTEKNEFFNKGKKSLIQGLILAYKNHYPITISPDMLWILFLQGYSKFMDKYAETFRSSYVNFKEQKTISVERFGIFPKEASKEIWQGIINDFTKGIKEHIGEEVISNLESNFSTTNPVSLTTSQLSIMSAMKHYFQYSLGMGGCGISSITLEGSLDDWKKMKEKFEFFSKKDYALVWWTKHLIPIIDKIIYTKSYYKQNNIVNDEIKNFWKDMIRVKIGKDYDPDIINGWIIKFIPNYSEQFPKLYDELKEEDIPDQIISCPLNLIVINLDGTKTEYNCSLFSGFYGMDQDETTYNVKPIIGYAVVVDSKFTSDFTKEDKNKLIDQFFS